MITKHKLIYNLYLVILIYNMFICLFLLLYILYSCCPSLLVFVCLSKIVKSKMLADKLLTLKCVINGKNPLWSFLVIVHVYILYICIQFNICDSIRN